MDVLRTTTCIPDKVITSERMVTRIVMHRHFAKRISVEKRLCCCRVVIDFVSKTQKYHIVTAYPACHKRIKYSQRLSMWQKIGLCQKS